MFKYFLVDVLMDFHGFVQFLHVFQVLERYEIFSKPIVLWFSAFPLSRCFWFYPWPFLDSLSNHGPGWPHGLQHEVDWAIVLAAFASEASPHLGSEEQLQTVAIRAVEKWILSTAKVGTKWRKSLSWRGGGVYVCMCVCMYTCVYYILTVLSAIYIRCLGWFTN